MSDEHFNETAAEIYAQAEEARRNKNFATSEELFRQCWQAKKQPQYAAGLLNCLREAGKTEDAWQILYESSELFPESHEIKKQHGWLLYDFELHPAKDRKNYQRIIEVAEKIISFQPDDLLVKICTFAATDAAKALNQPELILQFLGNLDKNKLEKTVREYMGRKIMSWRERWYFACINALYDTESFQECRQTCLEAKVDFPAKIEFARKAALCLAEMHQGNRAIKELEGIVQSKPAPWYMHLDLARILFENGQVEKAWSYACNAANARGEAKTKVNLFQLMARILLARGQRDFAALHLCLAQRIRKEQNWSIPDSLTDLIEKLNASTEVKESRELIRRCKNIWNKSSSTSSGSTKTTEKDDNRYEGYLIMKNPQTPFGFISCQAFKQNIYVKASDIPENLKHDGSKLSFKTETSFDAKKNRQSLKASDIKPA